MHPSTIADNMAARGGVLRAVEGRWPGWRRRSGSFAIALVLEAGLILLLLSLGNGIGGGRHSPSETLTSIAFRPDTPAIETPRQPQTAAAKTSPLVRPAPAPRPQPSNPATPAPIRKPAVALPAVRTAPAPAASAPPSAAPGRIAVRMRDDASGPAGAAGPSMGGDSQVVGSGPNGEPVYAARWYREPTDAQLRGYLSVVGQPGWAIINCKTAAGWRVEDCYLLDQHPDPSLMGQAVLAAAWQFQVRPPVKGGQSLVGDWVRIRISYEQRGN